MGFQMDEQPKTISVPEAGRRYFNLKRNGSYEAAHRGEIPVIRIGRRLRVPIVALERMLEEARPTARKAEAEELFADAGWPPEAA
jgi:hypothetical protein